MTQPMHPSQRGREKMRTTYVRQRVESMVYGFMAGCVIGAGYMGLLAIFEGPASLAILVAFVVAILVAAKYHEAKIIRESHEPPWEANP